MIAALERRLSSRPLITTFPVLMIALVVIASLAAAGVSYWVANSGNIERTRLTLRSELNTLQGTIEFLLESGEMQQVQQVMVDVRSDPHFALAVVTDEHLNVVAANNRERLGKSLLELLGQVDFDAAQSRLIVEPARSRLTGWMGMSASGNFMLGVYPVGLGGDRNSLGPQRIGILAVARDLRRDQGEMARSVSLGSILLVALSALMAGGLGLFGRRLITRRMAHLIATTNLVAAGKLDARADLEGDDELGRIGKAIDSMADQLRRSQEVADLSLAHTHRVLETSLDAAVVMDSEGIITLWNAHAERIFGWPAQEAVGRHMSDLIIPPRHRAAHIRGLKRFLQTGETRNIGRRIEIEALRRNGESFQVELAISLLPTGTGLCFSAFIRDITEQNAAVASANRRYQALVENLQEGILVVRDERVLFANPAMHRMIGYEDGDLIGIHVSEFLPPEELEIARDRSSRRLSGEPLENYREGVVLKKGSRERIQTAQRVTLTDYDGQIAFLGAITDITERKAAEAAIQAANQRYQALVENLQEGILVVRDCTILFANPAVHQMLGYENGELSGKSLLQVLPVEEHEAARRNDQHRLAGKPLQVHREGIMLKKGGQGRVYTEQRITLIEFDGEVVFLGALTDITERKAAENTIAAANRRYQTLVEHVKEGVMVARDEQILYANPAMHGILGYADGELVDRPLSILFPPEDWEKIKLRGRQRMAGADVPEDYEAVMVRRDGISRALVNTRVSRIDLDGSPALLGAVTDITEARRAEQSLKEANEKYRLMVEHPKDGMFIARDLHFLYANPALHQMLGYAPGELIGLSVAKVIAPEDFAGVSEREKRRLNNEPTPHNSELKLLRKGGAGHVFVDVYSTPATYEGVPAVLGTMHDITRRKETETQKELLQRQLLQAQKMEAIGQLTGGIAHDFNNILMSIRGYNSMALAAAEQGRSALVADDLAEVQVQVDRASDLVAKLLAFARGKSAGAAALDITATIDESFRMLRAVIPSGIELAWNGDAGLPAVAMDRVQLQQVLMNLCINARDAQEGKGSIAMRVACAAGATGVCQSCFQEFSGDFVRLCVSDQGPGIEPALLQRIFEPFFSTKEVGRGSGMGLAMVHGIVHEHGGHIQVSSGAGQGTSFNLFLPVAAGAIPEAQVDATEVEPLSPQPAQIMVVDDEASLCRYLTRLLRGKGYTVHPFNDPAEALHFFNANMDRVDLLLTDKTMPGMNGLELAEQVRSRRPELPVIIATGYADSAHEDEADRLGIYALLKKPASTEQILTAVSNALGQTRAT